MKNHARKKKANLAAFRKVSFGSIAKQKPDTRTAYPLLPDPQGRYAAIAARILERSVQVEALAGALEVDKAELKTLATPGYFTNASGKLDVPSSIGVTCSTGEVLITFQNRYGKLESEAPLPPILGDQTSRFFRQAFMLEIKGDKLPAEQTQALLDALRGSELSGQRCWCVPHPFRRLAQSNRRGLYAIAPMRVRKFSPSSNGFSISVWCCFGGDQWDLECERRFLQRGCQSSGKI
jgi:hypothetical protein